MSDENMNNGWKPRRIPFDSSGYRCGCRLSPTSISDKLMRRLKQKKVRQVFIQMGKRYREN